MPKLATVTNGFKQRFSLDRLAGGTHPMNTLNIRRLLPLLCTAAALYAGASQAATVAFDLTQGTNGTQSSYTSTSGGRSVTATAWVSEAGAAYDSASVTKSNGGLGVLSFGIGNAGMVDNAGTHVEALLFDFGASDYSALTVSFTQLGGGEAVNLWWGDSLNLANVGAPLASFVSNPGNNPFSLTNFGGARYLLVAAADNGLSTGGCGNDNSCFRVDGLTGTVPEPGALALVGLAGLLGAATTRRRKAGAALAH